MEKYKHIAYTLIVFLQAFLASGQEQIKNYVQQNAVPVSTIQPGNTDYSDLEPIGNAIGNARIVMLGEQDHGDAPTFLAKTRLIKYLHEKKGFNVLAFECDFFSMNYNWPLVKEGKMDVDDFVNQNIYAIWSQCTDCYPLFKDYLPSSLKTQRPLEITGFDNQMGTKYLLPILDSVLHHLKLPITTQPGYQSEILPLLTTWYNNTKDSAAADKVMCVYKEIKGQMLAKLPHDDFWVQTVENLIQQNLQFRNWKQDYWKDMNTRDKQMAINLRWLALTKYPAEKIIVWAHNYHVSKYGGHYPEDFLNKAVTMGTVFTQDMSLLDQTYIIGFTSYEGTAGRLFRETYKIRKPKANSFENWISPKQDYAFVDFKTYSPGNQKENDAFYMSGAIKAPMHNSQLGIWNKVYDGIFFIRKMYPCAR